jgi:hypothetical protein
MLDAPKICPAGGVLRNGVGAQAGWRLGVEVGSLSTFYSMEAPALGKAELPVRVTATPVADSLNLSALVTLPDATLLVTEHQSPMGRRLQVTALQDSLLMDAVLRYRIPLALAHKVYLGNHELPWRRANKYHQAEGRYALIEGPDGVTRQLTPFLGQAPKGMALFTYLRDEPEGWVLHIRLRAECPDRYSVRGCHRLYNRPFPAWAQSCLSRIPGFLARTLYLRERVSQRIPFQTNGAILLPRGAALDFGVVCTTW